MTKIIATLTLAATLLTGFGLVTVARADEAKPTLRTTSCKGGRQLKTPTYRACKAPKVPKAPKPVKGNPVSAPAGW